MTFRDAVGVFVRSFAQLAAAALIAVQGFDWASGDEIANNGYALGLALLAALIGALVAAGWSFVGTPATTPLGKAIRTAIEKIIGGIGVVAFNSAADVVQFGHILPPLLIAAALSFVITLLSYVSPPVVTPGPVVGRP